MSQRRAAQIRWSAFALALALALALAAPARAQAQERAPAIWYRASPQCPSDADFLAKLADSAVRPRLAEPGDHVDYLVTLVDSGTETVGRLERQTRAGTVAIRELRDASCARVAEGLALSLGLALEPGQAVADETRHAEPSTADAADGVPPAVATAPAPPPVGPPPARRTVPPIVDPPLAPAKRRFALGATAGVLYGLSPEPMTRGQVFFDIDPVWARLSHKFSARWGAVGALGSAATRIGAVRSWLLGSYLEGCPWRVGNALIGLRPCAGFELGVSSASPRSSAGFADRALWATPGAGLRASLELPYRLGLEAGAGVQVPLLRSQVFVGPSALYRAEIVLFQANLGLSVGLP